MSQAVPQRRAGDRQLDGVQFGRGVAACLVALYHGGRMLMLPQYVGHGTWVKSLFTFGNAGVDFFFVLSGFIIFHVHRRDIGHPGRVGHYLWRRVTRIYPMYWVVTALVILMLLLKRDWATLAPGHVVTSLLMLPYPVEPLLGVGWTLTHEVLFYAVFAVLILSRRIGMLLVLAWLGLTAVALAAPSGLILVQFLADPFHLEFLFGALAALAFSRSRSRLAGRVALIGVALFLATGALVDLGRLTGNEPLCRILFGGASALVLYGVSVSEREGWLRIPRWAAFLGAASYSIYLVHTLFIGFAARILFKIPLAHDLPNLSTLLAVGVAIAAGCLAYRLVEWPLQNAVRRAERTRKTAALEAVRP
jgi:peptidoglycan/LPS O-acetylase OafA/YrhL